MCACVCVRLSVVGFAGFGVGVGIGFGFCLLPRLILLCFSFSLSLRIVLYVENARATETTCVRIGVKIITKKNFNFLCKLQAAPSGGQSGNYAFNGRPGAGVRAHAAVVCSQLQLLALLLSCSLVLCCSCSSALSLSLTLRFIASALRWLQFNSGAAKLFLAQTVKILGNFSMALKGKFGHFEITQRPMLFTASLRIRINRNKTNGFV